MSFTFVIKRRSFSNFAPFLAALIYIGLICVSLSLALPAQAAAGTTINNAGVLAEITFAHAFDNGGFKVALTPTNIEALGISVYVEKTATGFRIVSKDKALATTQYSFDYIVIGATSNP